MSLSIRTYGMAGWRFGFMWMESCNQLNLTVISAIPSWMLEKSAQAHLVNTHTLSLVLLMDFMIARIEQNNEEKKTAFLLYSCALCMNVCVCVNTLASGICRFYLIFHGVNSDIFFFFLLFCSHVCVIFVYCHFMNAVVFLLLYSSPLEWRRSIVCAHLSTTTQQCCFCQCACIYICAN